MRKGEIGLERVGKGEEELRKSEATCRVRNEQL